MSEVNIALVQMNIAKSEYEKNQETVNRLLSEIDEKVDVIVLPEMWSVDFDFKQIKEHGEKHSAVTKDLSILAIENSAVVIGGSIPETIGNKVFNSTFIFDRQGKTQGKYWKMHLVSVNNLEGTIFEPGNCIPIFHIDNIPFGTATCYDIRFPELFRGIALNDAKIIFVTAQFANPLYNVWITLLKARAIENQVFIVAVNRVGKIYFGHSLVVSPTGDVIFEADDTEGIHVIKIDTTMVDKAQSKRRDSDIMNIDVYSKLVYKNNYIGVGAVVERDSKILMVKLNYGKQKGKWFLPGGYLDKGEMLEEGIEREVFEETTIKATCNNILAIRSIKNNDVIDCYIIFEMKYVEGTPQSDNFENTDVRFFSLEEIKNNDSITLLAKEISISYLLKKENKLVSDGEFISDQGNCKLYI